MAFKLVFCCCCYSCALCCTKRCLRISRRFLSRSSADVGWLTTTTTSTPFPTPIPCYSAGDERRGQPALCFRAATRFGVEMLHGSDNTALHSDPFVHLQLSGGRLADDGHSCSSVLCPAIQQSGVVQHHCVPARCSSCVRQLPQRHGDVTAAGDRVVDSWAVDRNVLPARHGHVAANVDGEPSRRAGVYNIRVVYVCVRARARKCVCVCVCLCVYRAPHCLAGSPHAPADRHLLHDCRPRTYLRTYPVPTHPPTHPSTRPYTPARVRSSHHHHSPTHPLTDTPKHTQTC
jgi:hypothetical protein